MSCPPAPPAWRPGSDEPCMVGILNVTPDSFSDGGRFQAADRAAARARAMAAEGAGMVDLGGESTRPGFVPVSLEEERGRVLPVLDALAGALPVPVSIDTTKAALAREAVLRGAAVVNDQWGFQGDPAMAGVVAEAGVAAILMHNRAAVDPEIDIVEDMLAFFGRSLAIAERAGVPRDRLVLDPGIGFGKAPAQQIEALRGVPRLCVAFGLPVLVGVSRKSMLGRLFEAPPEARLPHSLAANILAHRWGARLFRVHDVAEHVAAFRVLAALSRPEPASSKPKAGEGPSR